MAIAFGSVVNATSANAASVSQTGPTVSGSNTFGVVAVAWQSNEAASALTATWGGSGMTLVGEYSQESGTRRGALYYIVNPSSAATVQVTRGLTTNFISISSSYYTGAKQTGQPDSSATPTAASGTSFSASTTVVASNCWLVSLTRDAAGGIAASTGTTLRGDFVTAVGPAFADSNGTVGTGSQSMSFTGSNGAWSSVIFSMAPATTTVNSGFFGLM